MVVINLKDRTKEILSFVVGSELHDVWRKNRILEDGTYEPRIKETDDKEWIRENGTDKVDIANKSFAELPDDWQKENLELALCAIEFLNANGYDISQKAIEQGIKNVFWTCRMQFFKNKNILNKKAI